MDDGDASVFYPVVVLRLEGNGGGSLFRFGVVGDGDRQLFVGQPFDCHPLLSAFCERVCPLHATAVTVIVCGAVSSAAKESDVGVISSEAVVVSVSVGLHAAASMHAAATNNIFFIIHLCFRLFFQRRCNVPFNETYPHCGLLSRCTEHDGAVRRDIVDVSVRDNDAVVVVYPLLRTSQVDTRVEVVHPAGGHAESTDADECDAVVGGEFSADAP